MFVSKELMKTMCRTLIVLMCVFSVVWMFHFVYKYTHTLTESKIEMIDEIKNENIEKLGEILNEK